MEDIRVIDLGGSIVAPEKVDTKFLREYRDFIYKWLEEDASRKLIFIIGGGGPARIYQQAYREITANPESDVQDWIGIRATRLNAEFVKSAFSEYCLSPIVTDPSGTIDFQGRILVGAGWKPGFSTDYVSVMLAERFKAEVIYNLSNIKKVYTADPNKDPDAVPLDTVSWDDYKKMCGDTWTPGFNTPFDPIATKKAAELGLKVYVANGRELDNLKKLFNGENFFGTVMG